MWLLDHLALISCVLALAGVALLIWWARHPQCSAVAAILSEFVGLLLLAAVFLIVVYFLLE